MDLDTPDDYGIFGKYHNSVDDLISRAVFVDIFDEIKKIKDMLAEEWTVSNWMN